MILYRVPMLNDYPEFRASFIQSTATGELAYLDKAGKMCLFKAEIQVAVLELLGQANGKPVISKPVVSMNAYVESIERLARAFRA